MLRFCGQCGNSLTAAALHAGCCPVCGTPIESCGDFPDLSAVISSADDPTRPPADAFLAYAVPDTADTHTGGTDYTPAQQPEGSSRLDVNGSQSALPRGARLTRPQAPRQTHWALGLFLVVPLVLAGTSVLVLTQTGFLAALAPFGSTHSGTSANATASASAGGATSTSATATSATATAAAASHAHTWTSMPGATPSVTASPSPTPTATPQGSPVADPAYLSVTPTSFNFLTCVLAQTIQFTVANNGGTNMQWSATTSDGYNIVPSSGTIVAGGNQVVNVSQISGSGTVTITAPNAANSPQQAAITCKLL